MSRPSEQTESFPPLSPSAHMIRRVSGQNIPQRRRKSSSLGADPRGDTSAGSITTNLSRHHGPTGHDTPTERKSIEKGLRERKRTKAKKLLRRWKRTCHKHTWIVPLVLIIVLLAAYYISPGPHNPLHYAIFLSYADPPLDQRTDTLPAHIGNVTQYGKGKKDWAFVAFYTIVFTFTREFLMQRLIRPIAIRNGFRKRGKQSRFMEQCYTAMYHGTFGAYGLWVMSRTPVWYFNSTGYFVGFPHRAHEAWFKAYYLLEGAYWAQQGLVLLLQLEAPRKDFRELCIHHFVTLSLIWSSYWYHFTYMGLVVYITHDISDFFFATLKVLNYLDHPLTGPYFVVFVANWAYLRHYINLKMIATELPPANYTLRIPHFLVNNLPSSALPVSLRTAEFTFETGQFSTIGPYELNWETGQTKSFLANCISLTLLTTLQAVNLFWFALILRILYRFTFGTAPKDDRSEEEAEDEVEIEAVHDARLKAKQVYGVVGDGGAQPLGTPGIELNGHPVEEGEEYFGVKEGKDEKGAVKSGVRSKRR